MTTINASFGGPQFYDDCIGPLWFEPFAGDLARRLPPQPPGPVLEVACGTGIVTRRLREWLDPSVRLVATDISAPMLGYARTRLARHTGIEWQEADAQRLPFDAGHFGAVVCGFGLMFAPDRAAALRELRRVLVDGGWLLFDVWDRIEENPHALANAEAVEAMIPGDPQIRFRVPYEMNDPDLLRRLVADAGFADIQIETRRVAIAGADPRRMATGQIRGTPRSALLEQRGIALEVAIDRVAQALTQAGGDPYHGHAQALIVQARAGVGRQS